MSKVIAPFIPPQPRKAQIGIEIQYSPNTVPEADRAWAERLLREQGLAACCDIQTHSGPEGAALTLALSPEAQRTLTPDFDTLHVLERLQKAGLLLAPKGTEAAARQEIWVALLASPLPFVLPSLSELLAGITLRFHTAEAARRTTLAFKAYAAERPERYWTYDEDHGFLLRAGQSLMEALRHTTQPEVSGQVYDFSCYRATEYVIALALAQTLQSVNPPLYAAFEEQCRRHAIRSAQFHDVFMVEYGSLEQPLPLRYYVPGDRLWFRNPDSASAEVTGFEGSWLFYMGAGLFSDFWKPGKTFTIESKCLEIEHWRDGTYTDAQGELQMDEQRVAALVAEAARDPARVQAILKRQMRLRDPKGVYAEGGCIDASREYVRWITPEHGNLVLPDV